MAGGGIPPLDPFERRRLLLEADVDEKTWRRFSLGANVRPSSRRRILRALATLGLPTPTFQNSNAPGQGGARHSRGGARAAAAR